MRELKMTADELVASLLGLSEAEVVCILDSCGVSYLDSHLLIAGIRPVEVIELRHDDLQVSLETLDAKLSGNHAAIFTISYDLGRKMLNIGGQPLDPMASHEPDVFLALFDALVIHDYRTGRTAVYGPLTHKVTALMQASISDLKYEISSDPVSVNSNFGKSDYLAAIDEIQEQIRCGNTYQTNLTRQLTARLPDDRTPQTVFARLRRDHPAPFSAFITRPDSTVISASPERFIRVDGRRISTSPIKGTRPRGRDDQEDAALRAELLTSEKDRAENTMIVDLLRNDLGRVCEFGSVRVEKLCEIEEHPTFFHLVSTIQGQLRENIRFSELLRAVFPCGSITGAPKISTMKIIDRLETVPRGLSMGAIGYYAPPDWNSGLATYDLSVAIRTMVITDGSAIFNVGGGIVIDSIPEQEHEETLVKALALLDAINGKV